MVDDKLPIQRESERRILQELDRRQILRQIVGAGAMASLIGVANASSTPDDQAAEYETEPLSPPERGRLYGDIFSSSSFKTVKQSLHDEGFRLNHGDVTALKITDVDTGESRKLLKFPTRYVGASGETSGALLFSHLDSGKIFTRSISQVVPGPIKIDQCLTSADEKGPASPGRLFSIELPTEGGGDVDD